VEGVGRIGLEAAANDERGLARRRVTLRRTSRAWFAASGSRTTSSRGPPVVEVRLAVTPPGCGQVGRPAPQRPSRATVVLAFLAGRLSAHDAVAIGAHGNVLACGSVTAAGNTDGLVVVFPQ
jgi:hypothetical protein